jgi:mono/diheme cytochrome c family protein
VLKRTALIAAAALIVLAGGIGLGLTLRGGPESDGNAGADVAAHEASASVPETHRPFAVIDEYCISCHGTDKRSGRLAFDEFDVTDAVGEAARLERIVRKVRAGMMPPAGEPRPERAALDALADEIASRLDEAAAATPNPGAPVLHRLNRAEYANAIRDLLALDVDVTTLLPADDAAEGFDNIADVLVASPALIEGYVSAAMKISRQAIGDMTMLPARTVYEAPAGLDQSEHVEGLPIGTRGGLIVTHNFPLDAEYEFEIAAGAGFGFGRRSSTAPPPELVLTFDGEPAPTEDPRRFTARMPAGPVQIGVALADRAHADGVEDFYAGPPRVAGVSQLTIIGPHNATGPGESPSRREIFSCRPASPADEEPCAREILARLATSAFRRPVSEDGEEVDFLMGVYAEGRDRGGFEAGVERALAQLLIDPRFLFRIEETPDGLPDGAAYRISDLALASRLSFFLWSSIPDTELIETASEGRLSEPDTLRAEVERMLADPRAHALVDNFAGQWLHLRELEAVEPDTPAWDENLRRSLKRETELLFETIMSEDRSILELLDADYTFLDERLAQHYGVPGVRGSYFRRVALADDSPRRGLLGQGSVLTVTSVANRTSPVIRGAWILENILGSPPPPPPPGVETDLDNQAASQASTLRARLEAHRADAVCASCHNIMDPIGLSLENFDLIGAWREVDAGEPIDATGALVDGTPLDGPADLRRALLDRSASFVGVATEKLMTYALGRGLEHYDMPAVRAVVASAAEDDYRFSSLIYGVVTSEPFMMRMATARGDSGPDPSLALQSGSGE